MDRPLALLVTVLVGLSAITGACSVDNAAGDDAISGRWSLVEIGGAAPAVPVEITIDNGVAATVAAATECRRILGSLSVIETEPTGGDATFTMPGWSPGQCAAVDDETMEAVRDALEANRFWSVDSAASPTELRLGQGPDAPDLTLARQG